MNTQHYRPKDAQEILRRALARPTPTDAFSHAQLRAMAAELDIDAETLDRTAAEWQAEQEQADARRRFIAARRRGFLGHLIPYLAVNTGLIAANLLTDRADFWAIWPLLGWGIGLLSHGLCALRTHGDGFEADFRQWQADQQKESGHDQRPTAAV